MLHLVLSYADHRLPIISQQLAAATLAIPSICTVIASQRKSQTWYMYQKTVPHMYPVDCIMGLNSCKVPHHLPSFAGFAEVPLLYGIASVRLQHNTLYNELD